FTRKPRLQPAEFVITSAKRLLQHNLPLADIGVFTANDPATIMLACNGEPVGGLDDSSQRATLARAALCGLEGHARHAALVDANGRQGQAGADAVAEPFLARGAVRHRARPDHLANPLWRCRAPDRFRLHRPRVVGAGERWALSPSDPFAHAGGGILRRADGGA